jgi:hypothetical protein
MAPGLGTGVWGEGTLWGVVGHSQGFGGGGAGGRFTSSGEVGTGVVGESILGGSPFQIVGTGVSGRAPDLYQSLFQVCEGGQGVPPCGGLVGVGVRGESYYGVWGRGRTAFTPEASAERQGTGVRGDGYYGIYGRSANGFAGYFDGNVQVNGTLTATTLLQNSDRSLKANVAPVDGAAILRRLVTLPVHQWNYQSDPADVRHIGPMAQDFFAAFGVGADDRHIATVDQAGIALAAIQGLYQVILEKEEQINRLHKAVESLQIQITNSQPRPTNR